MGTGYVKEIVIWKAGVDYSATVGIQCLVQRQGI